MRKFPIKTITVDVEALGGKVTIHELTIEFRDKCNDDPTFDTPRNGLLGAGLSEDQVKCLGENVAIELYNEVIDLTYPNMREKLESMLKDGTYTPPSEEDVEKSKKN